MRRALLDVNVLLALLDSDHIDQARARVWLESEIGAGWASCAITERFVTVDRALSLTAVHGASEAHLTVL